MAEDEELNVREALEKARVAAAQISKPRTNDEIDAYWEVVCGDVLVAELNLREQDRDWEITSLTKEFLKHARVLEGFDHMLNSLYTAASRMAKTIYLHPRLKVEFLTFFREVVYRIESTSGHELAASEDLTNEIHRLSSNIAYADKGEFEKIVDESLLKHDPIEWTSRWEEVIDEANKIAYQELTDHPRGMGFCHSYWHELSYVLMSKFGLRWRTPSEMNPGVLFD